MDDRWNALVPYPWTAVKAMPSGPLAGMKLAVKDIFDVAGYPTGAGNPIILAKSGTKTRTSPLVRLLLDAGASFVGKSNTDELAYSLIGDNHHFGMPINPRRSERISGGSSSGSAVAVAAGLADIGLGTDTSGSVRLPAAINGIIGWRPSHGYLDMQAVRPLAPSFDVAGFLTTRLETMAVIMKVVGFPVIAPQPSAVIVAEDILDTIEPAISEQVVRYAVKTGLPLRRLRKLTSFDLDDLASCFVTILQAEAWESNKELFERYAMTIAPGVADRLRLGAALRFSEIANARKVRNAFQREMAEILTGTALLALPTLATDAPMRDSSITQLNSFRSACLRLLCLAGLGGFPQLSFPVSSGSTEFSISLLGGSGTDRHLMATALTLD